MKQTSLEASVQMQAQALALELQEQGLWDGGARAHTEYQKKPLEWIVKYLGVPENTLRWSMNEGYDQHIWDGDEDPLVQILEGLANKQDVGVESATGVGKSFLSACIVYWYLACHENAIVPTIAPKETQLLRQIWKEMGKLWPKFSPHFPEAEFLTGALRMKPAVEDKEVWSAYAFVCGVGAQEDSATKAQGIHAEHLLVITEETPGIHHAIMTALFNTRTYSGNIQLSLGNPDHQQDELHKFCMRPRVKHLRISAFDHPNVVTGKPIVPATVDRQRLQERAEELGEGNRLYGSRLRGISPTEAEDALIKRIWCEAAAARYNDDSFRQGPLGMGVDVADSPTGDFASIARGQGACLTDVDSFQVKEDAREIGKRIYREATDRENPIDPRHIGVDSVGVGATVVNDLKALGLKVRKISGNAKAIPGLDKDTHWSVTSVTEDGKLKAAGPKVVEAELYDNLRSQVWWRMREDLRLGRIALPNDPELFTDLCTPTYETPGKISVESKKAIKERLRRSPDKGDSACYWNWVRDRRPGNRNLSKEQLEESGMVAESANRSIGLERLVARLNKRRKAEDRRIARRYGGGA